mgnify:FL=1
MEDAGRPKDDGFRALACIDGAVTGIERRSPRQPGPGEVLVSLRVCGLCGTDIFKLEAASQPPGTVLGHEVVGIVERCGAEVEGFNPGDRVVVAHHVPCGECAYCLAGSETMCEDFRENRLSPGGFSEKIIVAAAAVSSAMRVIPDSLSDDTAVFLEPAACVLRGIWRSGLQPGGTSVILGGGSMGLLHLLVLKAALPDALVGVVEPLEDRRELALSLGADFSRAPETASNAVAELTGGLGADAIFDTAGGSGALLACLELGRRGSTVVLFAHAGAGEQAGFELDRLFKEERRLVASYSGGVKEQDAAWELMLSGALDPAALVSARVGLENFGQALELVRDRRALKVLIEP